MLDRNISVARHHAKIWRICNFQPNDVHLDVGCGYGELMVWAAKVCKKVVGVDSDKERYQVFNKFCQENVRQKINYISGDISDVKIEAGFTVATMVDVAEHIPEEMFDKVIDFVYNLLQKGGRFICYTPSLPFSVHDAQDTTPFIITDKIREKYPMIPNPHIISYSLKSLIEKFYKVGFAVSAAWIGSKEMLTTEEDIRTGHMRYRELYIIGRKM